MLSNIKLNGVPRQLFTVQAICGTKSLRKYVFKKRTQILTHEIPTQRARYKVQIRVAVCAFR